MATYTYTQGWESSSDAYMKYNLNYGGHSYLSKGDTLTISGIYYNAFADDGTTPTTLQIWYGTSMTAYDPSSYYVTQHCDVTNCKLSVKNSKTLSFTCTYTVSEDMISALEGSSLYLWLYFKPDNSTYEPNYKMAWYSSRSCQLKLIAERIKPVINSAVISDTTTAYSTFGGMLQNISDLNLASSITTDPNDSGVSIASRVLTIGGTDYSVTSDSFDLGTMDLTGTQAWSYTVTDNCGMSATVTSGSSPLTFLAYSAPTLTSNGAETPVERYEKTEGESAGEYIRTAADDGELVWYTYATTVSAVAGKNAWTLVAKYREYGADDWAGSVELASGDDGSDTAVTDAYTTATEALTFDAAVRYEIRLELTDQIQTVVLTDTIDKAGGYFYIGKNGIGMGMRSTGTESSPRVDVGYPMYGAEVYDTTKDVIVGHYIDSTGTYDIKRHTYMWSGSQKVAANANWQPHSIAYIAKENILSYQYILQNDYGSLYPTSYIYTTSNAIACIISATGLLNIRPVSTASTFVRLFFYVDYIDK